MPLKKITIYNNPLNRAEFIEHETEDLLELLTTVYPRWPQDAKLYCGHISLKTEVTPKTEEEINLLQTMQGPFFIVHSPLEPSTIAYVAIALVVATAVLMKPPAIPNVALRNSQQSSPNNELSERVNKPRPNGRIPDIFGTVRSTPDLISLPYKIFDNHQEIEYALMCVTKGAINPSDLKDDKTLISDIIGSSAEVYGPFTSPNSGTAQLTIGNPINRPVLSVVRSNSVNGQVLRAPNDQYVKGNLDISFESPNKITSDVYDFTSKFFANDVLTVSNGLIYSDYINDPRAIVAGTSSFTFIIPSSTLPPIYQPNKQIRLTGALFSIPDSDGFVIRSYDLSGEYTISSVSHASAIDPETSSIIHYCVVDLVSPATINPNWVQADGTTSAGVGIRIPDGAVLYDMNGAYTILSVTEDTIFLDQPELVNDQWEDITTTVPTSAFLSTSGLNWVGPFILDSRAMDGVISNFVAQNGLYLDDGRNKYPTNVTVEIEVTPINLANSPIGPPETFQAIAIGSATFRSTRAVTLEAELSFVGRARVRARRVTPAILSFDGSVIDEIKWRDVYATTLITAPHFGDITTIHSATRATDGALAIKERKLNLLATRKLPQRISGSNFTTELFPTNRASDIISFISLDPFIGRRQKEEVDFENIYLTEQQINSYFGTSLASEFNYTFDSDSLSFEETVQSIANSIFSTAYRRGSIVGLTFEKKTELSTMIFNHRTKIPGSETRSVRFGNQDDNDGVIFQWVDPVDDALVDLYIPADQSAVNPKKVESLGVRNGLQAHFLAHRAWNKIQYQNTTAEFTATQEADIAVVTDRVLCSDGTRPDMQDGEVTGVVGLQLYLSQNIKFEPGQDYIIFLQNIDGTVESIPIETGPLANTVVLESVPQSPLMYEPEQYAKTTFIIVKNEDTEADAFLLSEKSPASGLTIDLKLINYDMRYYTNDTDYIDGKVDLFGKPL